MESDAYVEFAERYDLFGSGANQEFSLEGAFFERLFKERGVSRVLDCACGTGRKTLGLFRGTSLIVMASDLSPAMLAIAQRNFDAAGAAIPTIQADFRELPRHFSESFDAVVCLATSIGEVRDDHEALRAFRSMRAVLRDGGILVLDQGTSDRQWNERPRFLLARDTPAFSRFFVIDYLGGNDAVYNILDMLRVDGADTRLSIWSVRLHILLENDQ